MKVFDHPSRGEQQEKKRRFRGLSRRNTPFTMALLSILLCLLLLLTLSSCKKNFGNRAEQTIEAEEHAGVTTALSATGDSGNRTSVDSDNPSAKTSSKFNTTRKTGFSSRKTLDGSRAKLIFDSAYSSPEDVAAYLQAFKQLPPNFLTKRDAQDRGWLPSEGNLWEVTDHMSIGGDRFYNREGVLPEKPGRKYYECDVNYKGGQRGGERIVFSNDGLIYYSSDHYNSFEKLYGKE